MTPQQLIRTILDAVAEDDLRKAEDAIEEYSNDYLNFVTFRFFQVGSLWKDDKNELHLSNKLYELFTQQNKP